MTSKALAKNGENTSKQARPCTWISSLTKQGLRVVCLGGEGGCWAVHEGLRIAHMVQAW